MRAGPPRYLRQNLYRLIIQAYIFVATLALYLTGHLDRWVAVWLFGGLALWGFLFSLGWRGDYD